MNLLSKRFLGSSIV